jgi:uncharacterized phage infection (PIP) family protein YhgE
MNPNRVDFLIDLAYGVLLFFAIVLIVYVGTGIGIAFGLGALVSYIIHVGWKMARFDPQWMTEQVTESIEETLTEEVTESVGEKVTEEVTQNVEETVTEEVTETVGEKVTEEVTETVGEKVTEEVAQNVEETVTEEVTESVEATLSEDIDSIIDRLEEVNERIDRRPRKDEIEESVGEVTEDAADERDGESTADGGR